MKIFCIGKNYAAHAREMQSQVPESPVVFMKPSTALLTEERPFYYPEFSNNIHYEVELVLRIGKQAKNVPVESAWNLISHVSLGIDFTARDVQARCKAKGHPWELAKSFDYSAALGREIPLDKFEKRQFRFHLDINGKRVQEGDTSQLVFDIPFLLHFISQRFTLQKGDLLYTGTPEGVGAVHPGDELMGYLEGQKILHTLIK